MITVEMSPEACAMLRSMLASQTCLVGAPDFAAVSAAAAEALAALDLALES